MRVTFLVNMWEEKEEDGGHRGRPLPPEVPEPREEGGKAGRMLGQEAELSQGSASPRLCGQASPAHQSPLSCGRDGPQNLGCPGHSL